MLDGLIDQADDGPLSRKVCKARIQEFVSVTALAVIEINAADGFTYVGARICNHFFSGYSNPTPMIQTVNIGAATIAMMFLLFRWMRISLISDNTMRKEVIDPNDEEPIMSPSRKLELLGIIIGGPFLGSYMLSELNGHSANGLQTLAAFGTVTGAVVGFAALLYLFCPCVRKPPPERTLESSLNTLGSS